MSKYTTGEMAKLCDVSVRTVQYYDTRGILIPSELSEGGRRLYSEDDLRKMTTICFLRNIGLSIDHISNLLQDENSTEIISLLLTEHANQLKSEIDERKEKLSRVEYLMREIKLSEDFSVNTLDDIAVAMKNQKELWKVYRTMIIFGLPVEILEWLFLIYGIVKGNWWLFFGTLLLSFIVVMPISIWYFGKVAYICPECHKVFCADVKDFLFAKHTPRTRMLTCKGCGHKGYCVEIYQKHEKEEK